MASFMSTKIKIPLIALTSSCASNFYQHVIKYPKVPHSGAPHLKAPAPCSDPIFTMLFQILYYPGYNLLHKSFITGSALTKV